MSTAMAEVTEVGSGDERRPLMTTGNIAWMNLGFFGVQFSFGLTQSAVNPIFLLLGAEAHSLPILNIAGPITGLLIQPFIGAMSDKTWIPRWGKRKPFVLGGGVVCVLILFLFPLVTALWMAVICLWLVDAGNNTAMEPYRALISDRLRKSQIPKGFLIQSMFTGAGAVLANVSLFVFQKLLTGASEAGVPTWVFVCFWFGAVCCLVTVGIAMLRTKEIAPSDEELARDPVVVEGSRRHGGRDRRGREGDADRHAQDRPRLLVPVVRDVHLLAVRQRQRRRVGLERGPGHARVRGGGRLGRPDERHVQLRHDDLRLVPAAVVPPLRRQAGARRHPGAGRHSHWPRCRTISNQYLTLVPMIGLGICWASMVGVPYLMVASMVPRERTGVYMGILNMMIVVPMLIQTLTFGWIFENLLGSKGTNAILLAGVLLGCAALAMLWVNPPAGDEDSSIMPLGPRHITVYNRVIVGSDGTPSSLYAVDRAHAVAAEAEARSWSSRPTPLQTPSRGPCR